MVGFASLYNYCEDGLRAGQGLNVQGGQQASESQAGGAGGV